jgi:hypothetical protein
VPAESLPGRQQQGPQADHDHTTDDQHDGPAHHHDGPAQAASPDHDDDRGTRGHDCAGRTATHDHHHGGRPRQRQLDWRKHRSADSDDGDDRGEHDHGRRRFVVGDDAPIRNDSTAPERVGRTRPLGELAGP